MSPSKVRRCYRCQSTQHIARFCPKANNPGKGDDQAAQVTVSACFGDACMLSATRTFSRDLVIGAQVDIPISVCALSHDETTSAQVCVDSDLPAGDEQTAWAFGEFPHIDLAVANTVKARATEVELSTLRYIDVDVEGRRCKGLVDSGAEICLLNEEVAREINADDI